MLEFIIVITTIIITFVHEKSKDFINLKVAVTITTTTTTIIAITTIIITTTTIIPFT
jgi:hypothetical protein